MHHSNMVVQSLVGKVFWTVCGEKKEDGEGERGREMRKKERRVQERVQGREEKESACIHKSSIPVSSKVYNQCH